MKTVAIVIALVLIAGAIVWSTKMERNPVASVEQTQP